MKNFKYTWKNFGAIKSGYDVEKIIIKIDSEEYNPTIIFSTGDFNGFTIIDKTYKLKNKELLEELSKVDIPDSNTPIDGLDGSAWEIEIDGKILKGYLDKPKWHEQIKKIIHFEDIFSYVDKKRKLYLEK